MNKQHEEKAMKIVIDALRRNHVKPILSEDGKKAKKKLDEYEKQLITKYRPAGAEVFRYSDLWTVATEEEYSKWYDLAEEYNKYI